MRIALSLALMMAAVPAAAQDWRMAPEYDVLLTTYDIVPKEIRLRAGVPVRLRFVNNTNRKLSFSAGGFFRSAQLRKRDKAAADGTIEVQALSSETVVLVPKAGRYKMRGRTFVHRLLGMDGKIVVE